MLRPLLLAALALGLSLPLQAQHYWSGGRAIPLTPVEGRSEADEGVGPVAKARRGASEGFALEPVYPNPSRDGATVAFVLGTAAEVRLSVYDVLGRRVAVLAEGHYEGGRHEMGLAASALAPGVYVVRAAVTALGDEGRVLTRRFTVVE